MSQAALARLLSISRSQMSLLLSGQRKMTIEYASEIARLLSVPVGDVLRNAGISVTGPIVNGEPDQVSIAMVGWIDSDYNVHLDWTNKGPKVTINCGLPPTAVAVQFRTAQTWLDVYDGWIVVTLPPSQIDPEAMVNRYCFVGLKDGRTLLRLIKRGYVPDRYNLLGVNVPPIHDADLAWFSPAIMFWPN